MQGKHGLAGSGALLLALLLLSNGAQAVDRLDGAWATGVSSCEDAFVKRKGKLVMKPGALEGMSGFIVNGKHIQGARASCNVISSKQKGDVTALLLGCKSKIIFDTMSVSIRFESNDSFVRLDPDFPEIQMRYMRCNR